MFCLPKTAWPPTCFLVCNGEPEPMKKGHGLIISVLFLCLLLPLPGFAEDETIPQTPPVTVSRSAENVKPTFPKSDRSHVVL